ncbi:VWA domain-containing protein [uncultured Mailhella sp.]|uniref:VWA domain-containing protein n=1 Tax=uncultured Mailhella sp. TaxID=1981031 RepID=UPI0025DE76FD|nr:VWA domain-containing protein [uncultured Mailhella sp.]
MSVTMKAMPLVASMLGNKLGVKVVIGSSDTACTNGDTIFLPPLPIDNEGVLYPLVSGFIDHEAAHIRHTDLGVLTGMRLTPVEKYLWNAIEDWRVEHEIIKRYPGCREHFIWLIRHFFLKDTEEEKAGENESPAFSVLYYVLLTLRSWDVPELIRNCELEAYIMEKHWPGLRSSIDTIMQDIPIRCRSTQDSLDFAQDILRLIEQEAQKEQKSTESSVLSPSPNVQDNPQQLQQKGGAQQPLQDLLQATEEELPLPMDKQISDAISRQYSPEKQKGVSVAVEGKLTTTELPDALIIEAQTISRALRTKLQGLLQSQVLRRSSPSRHGKLCGHGLYRIAVHDPRLFLKNESVTGIDTAVHILLDISGSMTSRIDLACASCYSVALALAVIPGISVGVSAFPADYEDDVTATVYPLLRHGERVVNSFSVEAHGSTPLTEAMWYVLGLLSTLPEKRKVMLVVTDGYPDDPETTKETITVAQRMGMEVLGIGINTPIISSIIHVSETITDIRELAPAMFRLLQHTMSEKRR